MFENRVCSVELAFTALDLPCLDAFISRNFHLKNPKILQQRGEISNNQTESFKMKKSDLKYLKINVENQFFVGVWPFFS